jgi:hypothetical protein
MNVVLKIALAYLEKHPEVIEQLIDAAVKAILHEVETLHAKPVGTITVLAAPKP